MSAKLWQPIKVGDLDLPHRLVMAPMTRNRSTPEGVPTELNAEYYAQRASTALIISEGVQPSEDGQGYLLTPGCYTPAHVAGWRKVTDAVHAAGGRIVIQFMHVGRIAHPDNTPHGRQPVGPSAVQPNIKMMTPTGLQDIPVPRALETSEVAQTVRDYAHAAACAMEAGADGVEIHGANGYIIHQFLSDNANQRTDKYGGSVENRIRFAVEVAAAVADRIGGGRTGIRIAPGNPFNDIVEKNIPVVYDALVRELAKLNLAYLHVNHMGDEDLLKTIRGLWPGVLFVNRGRTDLAARLADLENGLTDVITVGVMNLANPDLVKRIKLGAPLNTPDPTTFYGGGAKGYTDYPALNPA
jgi:N-ethylmaleimide reductase